MAYMSPYTNYYPQPQITTPISNSPQPQNSSNIIWVQGEAGAKSYLIAPNTTVQLWDSENPIIYLKSADASGMPSIKIIDYKIRDNNVQQNNLMSNGNDFATKEDINDLQIQLEDIKKEMEAISKPVRSRKREVAEDE